MPEGLNEGLLIATDWVDVDFRRFECSHGSQMIRVLGEIVGHDDCPGYLLDGDGGRNPIEVCRPA
ncbi:hypothetical protein [Devosia sp. DBB001]|nr:hypothetical protein [Devosia sp. DBB001]